MRKQNKIIISLCFIVLVANLVSVIFSSIRNMPIDSIDVLSILVTIILGVSAIVQAEQENKNLDYQTQLQIQNNTPYLYVDGIACNCMNDKDWIYEDCQKINRAMVEDPIRVIEDRIFMVSFEKNQTLNIDFYIQNLSDSLISYIKVGVVKEKTYCDNQYINGLRRCMDMLEAKQGYEKLIKELKEQSYEKLYTNDITNISKNEKKIVSIAIKTDQFANDIKKPIENGRPPEVLIFNICFYIYSVVGIWYEQNMEIGLRLKGHYQWNNKEQNIMGIYRTRYAYVLEKCVCSVGCVEDTAEIEKLNKVICIN